MSSIYRDRLLVCPHCGAKLDPPHARRDTWPCKACNGVAIHTPVLHRLLSRFAPQLVPPDRPIEIHPRDPTPHRLVCPACNDRMTQVTVVGVAVDRCAKDDLLWFGTHELELAIHAVIDGQEARKGWGAKLRDLLFAN